MSKIKIKTLRDNVKEQQNRIYKIFSELEVLSKVDSDSGRLAYQSLHEFEEDLEVTPFG